MKVEEQISNEEQDKFHKKTWKGNFVENNKKLLVKSTKAFKIRQRRKTASLDFMERSKNFIVL